MISPLSRSLLIIVTALPLFLASCASESCFEDTIPLVTATFYRTGSDEARTADSVTVYGAGKENNKLYDNVKNVEFLELPLDAATLSCKFVVRINGVTDTLGFTYSNYAHLISKECGISLFHILESYTSSRSRIDTIIFRNSNITTSYEENIRIFF